MRVKYTAISNCSGVSANPGAIVYMSQGMVISTKITRAIRINVRTEYICDAHRQAAAWPSRTNSLEKVGTNAALNAPSANSLLKKLGNLKATKNASAMGPAPKIEAIIMSRAKPKRRLSTVRLLTVMTDRTSCIGSYHKAFALN